jgi:hypothetical protein
MHASAWNANMAFLIVDCVEPTAAIHHLTLPEFFITIYDPDPHRALGEALPPPYLATRHVVWDLEPFGSRLVNHIN